MTSMLLMTYVIPPKTPGSFNEFNATLTVMLVRKATGIQGCSCINQGNMEMQDDEDV